MEKQKSSIQIMEIQWDALAIFRSRPNRFLGIIDIIDPPEDKSLGERVHIHDPGRLKELLYPGNEVLLKKAKKGSRSTKWDVIAAFYEGNWILVHSGYHSAIAESVIKNHKFSPFGKVRSITPEPRIGKSRLDFLLEKKNGKKIWVEVKGCTLAKNGIALFPDAPTERGRRHLEALISVKKKGDEAVVLILIFRPDAKSFTPNEEMDPEFSKTFYSALDVGIEVHPLKFKYENGIINYIGKIPLC